MRFRNAVYATAASVLFLSMLAGCMSASLAPPITATKHNAIINLQVVPNKSPNTLQKNGKLNCGTTRPQGCVRVPHGDTADITFKLPPGSAWKLTKFTLCRKGDAVPCKLNSQQRKDFELTPDGSGTLAYPNENGVVDLALLGDNLKKFVLADRNNVQQDYEYTIVACHTTKEICTTMDPPLENGGVH